MRSFIALFIIITCVLFHKVASSQTLASTQQKDASISETITTYLISEEIPRFMDVIAGDTRIEIIASMKGSKNER